MISKLTSKYFLAFLLIISTSEIVQCQQGNCAFEGVLDDIEVVIINGISETTPPNEILWVAKTENVVQATAAASPYVPYINGLRYSMRYEYQASDIFASFITIERTKVLERNVTYTCENQDYRNILFRFYILDENTEAPKFEGGPFNFTVLKSQADGPSSIITTGTKIIVRDMDFDEKNAQLTVHSTQPVFTPTISRDTSVDPVKFGFEFNVELSIAWADAKIGEYSFDIIVEDGKFSRDIPIIVDVMP